MPDEIMQEIADSISWWLIAASKFLDLHDSALLDMCCRILALPLDLGSGVFRHQEHMVHPVHDAVNHPVGHVTRVLLDLWFKGEPNDDEGLPESIKPLFTALSDIEVERFRHGRVLLASRLIALFRVDQAWTEKHLLPLFDWSTNPDEARAVWEGFLWSPRLYPPLLLAIRSPFLETAGHYSELGEHGT